MNCPKCGSQIDDTTQNLCYECGYRISAPETNSIPESKSTPSLSSPTKNNTDTIHKNIYDDDNSNFSDFIKFRKMVSNTIIKILYVIGAITLTILGIVILSTGREEEKLIGIVIIIFGNLLWRILCEGSIILFSIHESLISLNKKF